MTSDLEDNSLRYRRCQSVTRAEEITAKEKKARSNQFDRPCHVPRDSLFSWSSEFTDFSGLVNWGFLLLTIGGVRLCLENFLKYGFLVNPIEWIIVLTGYHEGVNHQYPSVILIIFSVVPPVICLLIEKAISVNMVSQRVGIILELSNILFLVSLPVAMLQFRGEHFSFIGITTVCTIYLVIFLKMWSYAQVNHWCRYGMKGKQSKNKLRRQSLSAPSWNELVNAEQEHGLGDSAETEQNVEDERNEDEAGAGIVKYPYNLNLKDLVYFILAPTLCYELNFPRSTRVRKRFLIKRILEVVFGINLVLALFQQWMIPSVKNSMDTFTQMDYVRITERLLKLAIPNHLIWLCFFYLTFHSFLNLMGELLNFADRNFYNDWWNSNNITVFWRTWNTPVHRWCVRHVYIPITEMGYSKQIATGGVFFLSAFFHEYLVSVPLQMFRVWAFLGMMAQPPLSLVSYVIERQFGARWGNLVVWSSLILGQPLVLMMYYHDYALIHFAPNNTLDSIPE